MYATYGHASTLVSHFRHCLWVKATTCDGELGDVAFASPGRMSWTYTDPDSSGSRVVSEGATVTIYDARSNQTYQEPADESPHAAALSFAAANLTLSFTLQIFTGYPTICSDCFVLVGTPLPPRASHYKGLSSRFGGSTTPKLKRSPQPDARWIAHADEALKG